MKFLLVLSIVLLVGSMTQQSEAQCVCTAELRQVCGTNGQTYDSPCWLKCAGAKLSHTGPC